MGVQRAQCPPNSILQSLAFTLSPGSSERALLTPDGERCSGSFCSDSGWEPATMFGCCSDRYTVKKDACLTGCLWDASLMCWLPDPGVDTPTCGWMFRDTDQLAPRIKLKWLSKKNVQRKPDFRENIQDKHWGGPDKISKFTIFISWAFSFHCLRVMLEQILCTVCCPTSLEAKSVYTCTAILGKRSSGLKEGMISAVDLWLDMVLHNNWI